LKKIIKFKNIMENTTNTEGANDMQQAQDLINASMIFARALGFILQEGEGIVVNVTGDINLGEDVKKVIVFKKDEQVHIYRCDEDIEEGTAVNLNMSSETTTDETTDSTEDNQ
jgi:pheromone shutdown protein TraB